MAYGKVVSILMILKSQLLLCWVTIPVRQLVLTLEIASQVMPLEQPPRETPQLTCRGVEHQEFYPEQ